VEAGDLDPLELHRQIVEHRLEEVVRERSRRRQPLEGVHDGRGLRRADEDRQEPGALFLAQQHDRLIRRNLDAHSD
jgi:hypothetical protein